VCLISCFILSFVCAIVFSDSASQSYYRFSLFHYPCSSDSMVILTLFPFFVSLPLCSASSFFYSLTRLLILPLEYPAPSKYLITAEVVDRALQLLLKCLAENLILPCAVQHRPATLRRLCLVFEGSGAVGDESWAKSGEYFAGGSWWAFPDGLRANFPARRHSSLQMDVPTPGNGLTPAMPGIRRLLRRDILAAVA